MQTQFVVSPYGCLTTAIQNNLASAIPESEAR
jgi:hypothetical protein